MSRPFFAYAASGLIHTLTLSCLAYLNPKDANPAFFMRKGDGGLGDVYAPLGSVGGAQTTPVFEITLPPVTAEEPDEAVAVIEPFSQALEPAEPTPTLAPVAAAETSLERTHDTTSEIALDAVKVESQAFEVESTLTAEVSRQEAAEAPPDANEEAIHLPRRQLALAPAVVETEVELPALAEANGRGEQGSGSGNISGEGNGGASGRAGGEFESLARTGPWNPGPVYPYAARIAGMEGIVYIRVQITAEGRIAQASVVRSSGWPLLDEAAMQILPRWRFEPARRGGVPVECELTIPFDFYFRRS